MNKKEPLGFSVYYSSFDSQKSMLIENAHKKAFIFLSLHIKEEFDEEYCTKMESICHWLAEMDYRVIADVSPNTILQFGEEDLVHLANRLHVYALRPDFGFTDDQILAMAKQMPLALNASTVSPDLCKKALNLGNPVMAMHNFYPRRETGLDEEYFLESTKALQALGVLVQAFIPGNTQLRGPLFEKLPTLEKHREVPPSIGYVELIESFGIDAVFVGDPSISEEDQKRILRYQKEEIIEIPCYLEKGYEKIYDRVFTCRIDSPKNLVRAEESRIDPLFAIPVVSDGGSPRFCGTITMDNQQYGRYAGEIQIPREDFPADHRVNCIGEVRKEFISMLDLIERGKRFVFTKC